MMLNCFDGMHAYIISTFLGLNHVVRKFSEPLDYLCNILISVPGGMEGPSGVLICAENYVVYKNVGEQGDIKMPIPRRMNDLDNPERGLLVGEFIYFNLLSEVSTSLILNRCTVGPA